MAGMPPALPTPPLLVITDRHLARCPLPDLATAAFEAGLRWLMVREKQLDEVALDALVGEIIVRARPYGDTTGPIRMSTSHWSQHAGRVLHTCA